jgi:hypothetical protein
LRQEQQRKMVERSLWIYSLSLAFLTAFAWILYWAKKKPDLLRPLFTGGDRFHDLTNYATKIAHLRDGGVALGRQATIRASDGSRLPSTVLSRAPASRAVVMTAWRWIT